jgi:catechol 2,3-dioxygenase-like lactoylglutathione lyase family enzyme
MNCDQRDRALPRRRGHHLRARAAVLGLIALLATAQAPPARPPITGIESVAFYTTQPKAAARFWTGVVGARPEAAPGAAGSRRFFLNGHQFVELLPVTAPPRTGMLAHIAYLTPDVPAMRRYLALIGHEAVCPIRRDPDGARWIAVHDPEGIEIRFVQASAPPVPAAPNSVSHRIIHAGHLVHDRAREDRFYRQLLGFRPYWYGGMRSGVIDWVSQQVPDGQDWFEYMLTASNHAAPDAAALGGMNHVSLGVPDVRETMRRLIAEDRPVSASAKPLLGRDGKWQLNLLDPDGTRVELMDFRASATPCCSPFTASDPTP